MRASAIAALAFLMLGAPALAADNGLYLGASVGQGYHDLESSTTGSVDLDDEDFAYKAFVGFRMLSFLAVEGGYRDLGQIENSDGTDYLATETTAWDAAGLLILPIGPVDLFGKVGVVWWDTEISGDVSASDDQTDAIYGIGLGVRVKSFAIRAELEYIDNELLDDLAMASIGATFTF